MDFKEIERSMDREYHATDKDRVLLWVMDIIIPLVAVGLIAWLAIVALTSP